MRDFLRLQLWVGVRQHSQIWPAPSLAAASCENRNVCSTNRELLKAVVANLDEITTLSKAQSEARTRGDEQLATRLDEQLDIMYAQKERSVGAWQQHVREHGCTGVSRSGPSAAKGGQVE